MNGGLSLFLDGDLASQASGEILHLAFLAIAGGASLVFGVLAFLLRRDLKRSEDEERRYRADVEKRFAAIEFNHSVLDEKVDTNKDRHGYEISDIKIEIGPLFREVGLPRPNWPSR